MGVVGELTRARLRRHPAGWLLLVVGVALSLALPVLSAATGLIVAGRALENAVAALPVGERSVVAAYGGTQDQDQQRRDDSTVRAGLARLTALPVSAQMLFGEISDGGGVTFRLGASDALASQVRLTSGRAALQVHAAALRGARDRDCRGSGARPRARARGRRHRRAHRPAPAARHVRPRSRLVRAAVVGSRCAATALVADPVPTRRRLGRGRRSAAHRGRSASRRTPTSRGRSPTSSPSTSTPSCSPCPTTRCCARTPAPPPRRAASPSSGARPRCSSSASCWSRRRGCAASTSRRRRCCAAGAPRVAPVPGSRSRAPGWRSPSAPWSDSVSAGSRPTSRPRRSRCTRRRRSRRPPPPSTPCPGCSGSLVVAVALTAAVLMWPSTRARSAWHVVEAAAAVSLLVAALLAARGSVGGAQVGRDPLAALLPVLVLLAAALLAARLWVPLAAWTSRHLPTRAIAARLSAATGVHRPLRTVVTVGFLTAAVGTVVFAGAYRATLQAGSADTAAFDVPADVRLAVGHDSAPSRSTCWRRRHCPDARAPCCAPSRACEPPPRPASPSGCSASTRQRSPTCPGGTAPSAARTRPTSPWPCSRRRPSRTRRRRSTTRPRACPSPSARGSAASTSGSTWWPGSAPPTAATHPCRWRTPTARCPVRCPTSAAGAPCAR